MKLIYLLFAVFCKQVFAQNYYITNPIQGTVFTANNTASIVWVKVENPQLSDVNSIRIDLVDADPDNARFVRLVAEVPPSVSSFEWKVPSTLEPKSDYFLRMGAKSKTGRVVYNYSARFSILGGKAPERKDKSDDKSNGNKETIDIMITFMMIFLCMNY